MLGRIIVLSLAAVAAAGPFVQPTQVHVAFADASSLRVAWKTDNATNATLCSYGAAPGSLTSSASGSSVSYLAGYGVHHTVRLSPLPAGWATVYYSCGDGAGAVTPVLSVARPPPPGDARPFRQAIFGDWGWLNSTVRPTLNVGGLDANWTASFTQELIATLAANASIDAVHIVGDIAYADDGFGHPDELLKFSYEDVYNGFMDIVSSSSAPASGSPGIPWMVSAGNHESECHSPACILDLNVLGLKLNNFTAYNTRWPMPAPESGGVESMWYSYTRSSVHFVSINTETDFAGAEEENTGDGHFAFLPAGHFGADGEYMAWLAKDLAAASADPNVKWIIAGGHRPFEDLPAAHASALAALFKSAGVAFYFAGHGHSYTRFDPSAWDSGAVHVMVGGAGCDEMPFPSDQWAGGPPPAPAEPCARCRVNGGASPLFATDQYAIGVLETTPTRAAWRLLRAPDGVELDSVVLTKP